MASKAQIKARKLFALRSKRGDFRKGKKSRDTSTTATPRASKRIIGKEFKKLKRQSSLSKPKVYSDLAIELKNKFKGKSDADLRRIIRTKKGNTDDEGYELGRRIAERL